MLEKKIMKLFEILPSKAEKRQTMIGHFCVIIYYFLREKRQLKGISKLEKDDRKL